MNQIRLLQGVSEKIYGQNAYVVIRGKSVSTRSSRNKVYSKGKVAERLKATDCKVRLERAYE